MTHDFPIALVFFIREPGNLAIAEKYASELSQPAHPFNIPLERLHFFPSFTQSEEEFGAKLIEILFSQKNLHAIIVSDQLVSFQGHSSFATSNPADVALESFYTNQRLCSLISLYPESTGDIPGIMFSLNSRNLNRQVLREAIAKAGTRLHLLSPASQAQLDSIKATDVSVQVAQSPNDLRQILALRHRVYSMAGYLDSETEKNPLGLEMDYYDGSAIQLMAKDEATGNIAGVMRLIFANKPWGAVDSIFGPFCEIFEQQRNWYREIINEVVPGPMRDRLLKPGGAPLPLLNNLRVTNMTEWQTIVDGVEISRIIVAPEYRGLAVARLLTRLSLAALYDMGKKLVVGECQPTHMPMYRKLGFKTIETEDEKITHSAGNYKFHYGQRISIDLTEGMKDKAIHIARGDLSLIKLANKNLSKLKNSAFTVKLGHYRVEKDEQCP